VLILLVLTPAAAMADCGSISYQAGGPGDPCQGAAIVGIATADTVAVGATLGLTITSVVLTALSQSASGFSAAMAAAIGPAPVATPNAPPASSPPAVTPPAAGFTLPSVAPPVSRMPPGGRPSAGERPGGAGSGPGSWPHVQQRGGEWCGAACGEMAAGRLGARVSQDQLAATSHFWPDFVVDGEVTTPGGFQTEGLSAALTEVAPVPGRFWKGGTIPQDMSTPAGLREVLSGYLDSTNASIILRVRGGAHWIVVDEVTAEGRIAIRDPGAPGPATVSAEQLHMMHPVGDAVFSFPQEQ